MNKEVDTSEFKSFFKSVQGNEGDKDVYKRQKAGRGSSVFV